jgi:hypothetical protein
VLRDWLVMTLATVKLGAVLILAAVVLTLSMIWRR